MCTTGRCVHFSSGDGSVLAAVLHFLFDCVVSINEMSRKSFDVDTHGFVLTNFVALFGSFGDGNKKVLYSFVVNFEHRHVHFELFVGVIIGCDSIENLLTGNGHNTLNYAMITLLAP